MREKFSVDREAPLPVSDLARQVEDAFGRINWDFYPGPYTSKSDLVDRMTDVECDTFDEMLDVVASRLRLKWGATSALYHRATDFPAFRAQMEETFGKARSDFLLAPSR